MERIKEIVPHFLEVKADQPAQVIENGWPVDILPITNTPFGRVVGNHNKPLMQPSQKCCSENIWFPMAAAMKELGATLIIRGQRMKDHRKGSLRSGDILDGVQYWFPIENWSSAQVIDFLKDNDLLPPHYADTESSLDCRSCTAYLDEHAGKMRWMSKHHPALYREVQKRLRVIRGAVYSELQTIDSVIEHGKEQ